MAAIPAGAPGTAMPMPMPLPMTDPLDKRWTWLVLGSLLVLVTAIRSWPLFSYSTWMIDEERIVTIALGFLDGDLNPRWFNYHPLPMYLLAGWYLVQYGLYSLLGLVASKAEFAALLFSNDAHLYVSAKLFFSLAYGLGCLVMARLVLKRTGSWPGAVLCMLLPLLLVDAQAAGVQVRNDTFVFLFLALTVYFSCVAERTPRNAVLAVAACAAAFACKIPAIVLLPVLVVCLGWDAWRRQYRWPVVIGALALFPVFVFLFMPYAVLDFDAYRPTLERTASRASGEFVHVGKALHFSVLDKLGNLVQVIRQNVGLSALVGTVLCGLYGIWRDRRMLFAALFVLAYGVAFSTSTSVDGYWLRPFYPMAIGLTILVALLVADDTAVRQWLSRRTGGDGVGRATLLAVVAGLLVLANWGGMRGVINGFAKQPEDTRIVAEKWIAAQLPAGSTVALEGFLPHYLPRVFSKDPKITLAVQNYLFPTVVENRLLMSGFEHYMAQSITTLKPFQVRVVSDLHRKGYAPGSIAFSVGEYIVISERVYRRFYRQQFARQAPQLAQNAKAFYAFVRSQQPVKVFTGNGPTIEIYRVRPRQ